MINTRDIKELITQAQSDYVMGIVNEALPKAPSAEKLSEIVMDLAQPENCHSSGYDFDNQVRDYVFENSEYILEVQVPA